MTRRLTVPEKHQKRIAQDTLRMSDIGALIMGGMSKEEATDFLISIGCWTGTTPAEQSPHFRTEDNHDGHPSAA